VASKYKGWKNVPVFEQQQLHTMMDEFGRETGYQFKVSDAQLLAMANGNVLTQQDFGAYAMKHLSGANPALKSMPWAQYGLTKDSYQQLATTYSTEYRKVTGQDIPASALTKAFLTSNLTGGGLLSGSQYSQQLMNDTAMQKQYGWIKYGLDFTAWTQQKLSMRGAMGRNINDAEAANILQYTKAATGSSMSAIAHQTGQQSQAPASAGVGGSVAR
jgi:hypothetical protein